MTHVRVGTSTTTHLERLLEGPESRGGPREGDARKRQRKKETVWVGGEPCDGE